MTLSCWRRKLKKRQQFDAYILKESIKWNYFLKMNELNEKIKKRKERMTQTLKETSSAVALLSVSLVAEAASKMPDPEQVNNVMSLLTQFIVLGIAIWRAIKKPKNK